MTVVQNVRIGAARAIVGALVRIYIQIHRGGILKCKPHLAHTHALLHYNIAETYGIHSVILWWGHYKCLDTRFVLHITTERSDITYNMPHLQRSSKILVKLTVNVHLNEHIICKSVYIEK
jgi:hypothetical protein